MDLLILVLVLMLIGFAVWYLTESIPALGAWKQAVQVFAFIVLFLYLVTRFVKLPNILS